PHEWELKSEQLGFTPIEGNHSDTNIGGILVWTVDHYNIRDKIGWFTANNTSNNFPAIKEVASQLGPSTADWNTKQSTQLIYLPSTSSTQKILKKIKHAFEEVELNDDLDLDVLDACLSKCNHTSFITALNYFAEVADESDDVPNLKGKTYSNFRIQKSDWEKITLMHEVLKEPASAKQTFLSSKEPSVFCTIPVLEYLQESWGNMANHLKFAEVEEPLQKGIENLEKWYHKNTYAKDKWDEESYSAGVAHLETVPSQTLIDQTLELIYINISAKAEGQYGYSRMHTAVQSRQDAERVHTGPHNELKQYLESPLKEVNNVISWWGVCHIPLSLHFTFLNVYSSIMRDSTQHYLAWPVIISPFKDPPPHPSMPSQVEESPGLLAVIVLKVMPSKLYNC
ncbi:hypothetical protein BYT27DRAFT_7091263, partial [Phlegmacium glaucopus]